MNKGPLHNARCYITLPALAFVNWTIVFLLQSVCFKLEVLCLPQVEKLAYLCQLKMNVVLFAHIQIQCLIIILKYLTKKEICNRRSNIQYT